MNKSSFAWGSVLLLLGLLMLAEAAGLRLPGGARPLSFFWPILLILLGGWMILNVTGRATPLQDEHASIDLQGATQASVRISHGAGEFHLSGGVGMSQLATGRFAGGLEQSSRLNQGVLEVRMSPPGQPFEVLSRFDRFDWDFQLNSEIPMSLNLQMGGNKSQIDLSRMKLTALKVEAGASQTEVTLPAHGRLRADFHLGAASLTIHVPEGVPARIRVSQGVSSVSINEARFPRSGDYYQSQDQDYETAADALEIRVEAGAAEIRIP